MQDATCQLAYLYFFFFLPLDLFIRLLLYMYIVLTKVIAEIPECSKISENESNLERLPGSTCNGGLLPTLQVLLLCV